MRGKKKKNVAPANPAPKSFEYTPFKELKGRELAPPPSPAPPEPPPPEERAALHRDAAPDSETDAFSDMVAGTVPLAGRPPLAPLITTAPRLPLPKDDASLVMRELDDLVSGVTPFDFADTEEYIEASVRGLDRRVLRQLRRGELSVQAHLDLHGMRREEARLEVAQFVAKAHTEGKKCVLIVHGRGLGSKDNIPVLKEKLTAWLTRGAIGKRVLAFTSARPWDGGTGAVYVLLRS